MTSIENKCKKYSEINNMPLNGYSFGEMFSEVENALDKVCKYIFLDYTQYHHILDQATVNFKNPENLAIREEISENLCLLGYSFVSNGVNKNI